MKGFSFSASKRRTVATASIVLSSICLSNGEDDCPPGYDGWIPAPGCKQYHLCEGGKQTTPEYNCRDGFLFDADVTNCLQESSAKCVREAASTDAAEKSKTESSTSAQETKTKSTLSAAEFNHTPNENPPTKNSSCGGMPEVYFINVPQQTCFSTCQTTKPDWIQETYPNREECCEANFPWMSLEDCLKVEYSGQDNKNAQMWTKATALPTSVPIEATPRPTGAPTKAPVVPLTPDDEEYYFMCGSDWGDASARCHLRCPGGEDTECPTGEICFSKTSCDGVVGETPALTDPPQTDAPTLRPTQRTERPTTAPADAPATDAPTLRPTLRTEEPTAAPTDPPPTDAPTLRPTPRTEEPTTAPTDPPPTDAPAPRPRPRTKRPTSTATPNPTTSTAEYLTLTHSSPVAYKTPAPTDPPATSPVTYITHAPVTTVTPTPIFGAATEAPSNATNITMSSNYSSPSPTVPNVTSLSPIVPTLASNLATSSPSIAAMSSNYSSPSPTVTNVITLSPTVPTLSPNLATSSPSENTTSTLIMPTSSPTVSIELIPMHSPITEPPNFVVSMIASPETTSSMQTMSEPFDESPFNSAYGYGMVPPMNSDQQGPQDFVQSYDEGSQSSYLSMYSDIYGGITSDETQAQALPSHSSEDFFSSFTTTVEEIIIPVSADATISQCRPDLNFGSNPELALAGGNTPEQFDILLKFDVSAVDHDSSIQSATLRIYATEDCASGGMFHSTTSFNADWDSDSIAWNTAPYSEVLLDTLGGISTNQWYAVDVIGAFATPPFSDFITIRIESMTEGRCMFAAMEKQPGLEAYIVLEMEEKPQSDIIVMSGSLPIDDPPVEMNFAQPVLPIIGGEFVMVRAIADATIDAIHVGEKLGALPSLHISWSREPRQIFESLICFDLTEFQQQLPTSAMLVLFPERNCHSAGKIAVTGMNEIWSEKDMTWTRAPYSEVEVGTFGSIEAGHWFGFNVIKALEWAYQSGKTSITFRLSADGDYSCQYSSIQSGRAPKLLAAF